jgi:hypothetical protein
MRFLADPAPSRVDPLGTVGAAGVPRRQYVKRPAFIVIDFLERFLDIGSSRTARNITFLPPLSPFR